MSKNSFSNMLCLRETFTHNLRVLLLRNINCNVNYNIMSEIEDKLWNDLRYNIRVVLKNNLGI